MRLQNIIAGASLLLATGAQAQTLQPLTYQQALELVAQAPTAISDSLQSAPQVYSFINSQGEESVNYTGQVFRQVLINDIKLIAGSIERGEFAGNETQAYQTLDSVFSYKPDQLLVSGKAINGDSRHFVRVTEIANPEIDVYEGAFYGSIFSGSTNLLAKTAGVDNPTINQEVLGWNSPTINGVVIDANGDGKKSPEEFIRAIMRAIAVNAADRSALAVENPGVGTQSVRAAAVTADGVDLSQLLQKVLHGAVSLSQAADDYLSVDLGPDKGLNADNDSLYPNRPFTVLEHHWDEAFGYFGAARDYLSYTDREIARGLSVDSFAGETYSTEEGDGEISLEREKNFGMAVNAGKRDVTAADGLEDFSKKIFSALINGRHLISTKPDAYRQYAHAYGVIALVEWEKVMAATAVHYANAVLRDLEAYGKSEFDFTKLAKHFGELKGFAMAPQFSRVSPMSRADFDRLHLLIKEAPALGDVQAYRDDLLEARELLGRVYNFSKTNLEAW